MDGGELTDGLQETLSVFQAADRPLEPLTTSEVAGELDISRRSTYDRLERLADRRLLATKKVGAKGRVWWPCGPAERPRGEWGSQMDGTQSDGPVLAGPLADSLFENQRDVVYAVNDDGELVRWNDRFASVTGYADEEIGGMHVLEFVADDAHEETITALQAVVRDGETRTVELPVVTAGGERVSFEVSGSPVRDAEGDIVGLTGVGRDVSHRKRKERELERERDEVARELEDVFERVDDAFFALDEDWEFTYVNERAAEVLERSAGELLGESIWEAFPSAVGSTFAEAYERAVETQESITFEEYFPPLSAWFEVNAYPSEDGLSVYFRDVTARTERERELEQYEALAETATDVIVTIDTDSVIRDVNPAVADVFGYEPATVVGESLASLMPDEYVDGHDDALAAYLESGDRTLDWEYVELTGERADGTEIPLAISFSEYEHGGERYFTGIVRDVSEREARERELKRFEAVVQTMSDGVYVVDEEGRFAMVNDAFAEMTGYDRSDLLGTHGSRLVDDETIDRVRQLEDELARDERTTARVEATLERADGGGITAEATFALLADDEGTHQRVAVVRDVTERRERERALEESRRRYRALVENFPNGAVALVDDDLRYVTVGGEPIARNADDATDLEGEYVREFLPADVAETFASSYEAALEGESNELEVESPDGSHSQVETFPVRDADGEVFAAMGMSQDVTEQREYERELERRVRQQEAVTQLGQRALEDLDVEALLSEAASLVATTLETDVCTVFDRDEVTGDLLVREAVGLDGDRTREVAVPVTESDVQAAVTLESGEPVVVEDREAEGRVGVADPLAGDGLRSGISVIIGSPDDSWGVLGAHDAEARSFSDEDVTFLQSVATILATAIERRDHERELVRQREELAALNDLHEVVNGVTDAVLSQSTRDEIERTAAEHLVAADSYTFAWIAEADPRTGSITERVQAGADGYLDAVDLSVDVDEPAGQGPTGAAFRTGEIQVSRDVFADPTFEPWHDAAREHGFDAFAAIPIVHGGTQYGVLGLATERAGAFAEPERAVVGQLGEVVGHAIAAAERKRALMSEEVVQLEFRVPGIYEALGTGLEPVGEITFDQMVPIGDDEFLVYGEATADAVDSLRTMVDGMDHWSSLALHGEADPVEFELRLSEPPVLSALAALGGSVEDATIADGDYRMVLQVPRDADVQRLVRTVREAYGTAELMTRRQLTSRQVSTDDPDEIVDDRLTERQRASLRAAFHAGFFEWPRDTSGEAIAESMDVSPPTFHQHLRKAEQKVFESLLGE